MNPSKACSWCGQQFQPRSSLQRFCTACIRSGLREYRRSYDRRYYNEHRDAITARARARWLERKNSDLSNQESFKPRICMRCSNQYAPASANQKYCQPCRVIVKRDWSRLNNREYRRKYPERFRESKRRCIEKDSVRYRASQHESWKKYIGRIKREVIGYYSNGTFSCACCGESEFDFLSLDHVNNNGAEERRTLFGRNRAGSYRLYSLLIRRGFPPGYAILCMNCNFSKGKHGACVHTARPTEAFSPLLKPGTIDSGEPKE